VAYYTNHYLQTKGDMLNISKSVEHDILPTWISRAGYSILDLAISCMALTVFSRTHRHPPAAVEASVRYHRLLRHTQTTILSLDKTNIDNCLLAIFFMGRYEDAVYRPSLSNQKSTLTSKLRSFSHHDGALSILKVWKEKFSQSHPATDVIKHTRSGLIRSALLRNAALPEWMKDGTIFGEHGLELEYDCIVTRIAGLRYQLATFLRKKSSIESPHEITSMAEELHNEAQEIDKALQTWANHFPITWSYQQHTLPDPHPWPMRDFYSPVVYSYSSPSYAAIWSRYFATRILLNSTHLRILKLIPSMHDDFLDEQKLTCISLIKNMANGLASSIPLCLQRFEITKNSDPVSDHQLITLNTNKDIKPCMATLVVWPLTIASSIGDVDVKQKIWFKSELARLGRIVGFGVLECAESNEWPINDLNFDEK
jgi:hypothetical protein